MATMNISIPDALRASVDEQVEARGYGSSSEYVRDLIRRDLDREALRALLLEGPRSGPSEPVTPEFLDRLRRRARGSLSE